jgi:hypothetical protein
LEEELDRFDAECRDMGYDENSEVDAIQNDIENLLLREHIRSTCISRNCC